MAKKKFMGNMDFSTKLKEEMEDFETDVKEEIEEEKPKKTTINSEQEEKTGKSKENEKVEINVNQKRASADGVVSNPAFALPKQKMKEKKSVHKNILITPTDYENLMAEAEELGTTFNNLLHLIFEQRYER